MIPHLDGTITVGNLLTILSMVLVVFAAWHSFKLWISVEIAKIMVTLVEHTKSIAYHTDRLDKFEDAHKGLIRDMQQLIGQVDILIRMMPSDRRQGPVR